MASQLGKRYHCKVCNSEMLCTKVGEGVITCDGQEVELQEAKQLPSSD